MKNLRRLAVLPALALGAACSDLATEPTLTATGALSGATPSSASDIFVYGAENGPGRGDLWKANLTAGTAELVYAFGSDPSADQFSPNGLAFDGASARLYYSLTLGPGNPGDDSDLYYIDVDAASPAPVLARAGLSGRVYNADIWNGSYYYVVNETSTLTRVGLNPDGTAGAPVPVCGSIFAGGLAFGDIAIRDGVVYGSARRGVGAPGEEVFFFTVDVGSCATSFISKGTGDMLQLAWGADGNLYGHFTNNGAFVRVDPANGDVIETLHATITLPDVGRAAFFSDLAPAFVPTPPGQGCTPGFWKNHSGHWGPTGYDPNQQFSSVFGPTPKNGQTLDEAVGQGGGGWHALGRHAVAALLNAAHPNVNYALTPAQVIALVQQAAASPGQVEAIKNTLEGYNEAGCSLPGGPQFR
jgi:hypothetical protein